MAQPYVGEIRMFGGNFAPAGWLFCNGQLLPISENETLFQLIGTTYGGDGQSTFALPNLQSRAPVHMGNGSDGQICQLAQQAGTESVTLTVQQIPVHTHPMIASNAASTLAPTNALLTVPTSSQQGANIYHNAPGAMVPLHPGSITPVGGSQPHENCQPFVCISFIISLFGIFPTPT